MSTKSSISQQTAACRDLTDEDLSYLSLNSYISERYKIHYIATPKAACTSIKWWFAELEGIDFRSRDTRRSGETQSDLVIHEYFNRIAPSVTGVDRQTLLEVLRDDSFFRFALVRNPFERIFSAWQSKVLLHVPMQIGTFLDREFLHRKIKCAKDIALSFEGFLEYLRAEEWPAFTDHHWMAQAEILRLAKVKYTSIAKVEESEALWQSIADRIEKQGGYMPAVQRANEGLLPYSGRFITPKCAELVRELYEIDFASFGYAFDLPQERVKFDETQIDLAIRASGMIRDRHQRFAEVQSVLAQETAALQGLRAELLETTRAVADRDGRLATLSQTVADSEAAIAQLQRTVAERDAQIGVLSETVTERDGRLDDLSQALAEREADIVRLEADIVRLEKAVAERDARLSVIFSSLGWKLLTRYRLLVERLFPYYTRRRRLYDLSRRAVWVGRQEGVGGLSRAVIRFVGTRIGGRQSASFLSPSPPMLVVRASAARENKTAPFVSIVLHAQPENPGIEPIGEILEALGRQTTSSWEVVVLTTSGNEFLRVDGATGSVQREVAETSVLDVCRGSYLYCPAHDFTAVPVNWLEVNILALEAQDLLLTCNSVGNHCGGGLARVLNGARPSCQPGKDALFYHRTLASQTDCALDSDKLVAHPHIVEKRYFGRLISWPGVHSLGSGAMLPIADLIGCQTAPVSECDSFLALGQSGSAKYVDVYPVNRLVEPQPARTEKPVLLVHLSVLAIGGAERLTYDLLNSIKDRYRFVVFTSDRHSSEVGSAHEMFKKLGAYVYDLGECAVPQVQFSVLCYLMKKYEPATLFVANGSNFFYDNLQAIRTCFPGVRIVNQLFDHEAGWVTRYDETAVECIDVHIACNRKIQNAYLERFDIPEDKIACIQHGIDVDDFFSAQIDSEMRRKRRLEFGVPADSIVVCFIARLHPQKRPNDFLKLAKRFEHDSRYYFLMVGDGPLRQNVDEFVELYQLKNFTKMGFYQPISDILSISDILMITSEYEGLPLVVLNALAMSVVVVSTDVGNVKEVVERDGAGIVAPGIGDIDALSDALSNAAGRLAEMKLRGQKTVREAHDIRDKAAAYMAAFNGGTGG